VLPFLLAFALAAPVEVERVLAVVNGVPVLSSDVELATAGGLVPREPGESDVDYRKAVVNALVDLELRWQDLNSSGIALRMPVDLDAAWRAPVQRAGGEEPLRQRLAQLGLSERDLRELVRRAAVVQAYVASRFAPFVRPAPSEIEAAWRQELVPELEKAGRPVPPLADVRAEVEALLRERKLLAEIDRWTGELAKRAEIVRFLPGAPGAAGLAPTPAAAPSAPGPVAHRQ